MKHLFAFIPFAAAALTVVGCTRAPSQCPSSPVSQSVASSSATPPQSSSPPKSVTISIVETNDLHGHVRLLPYFAGFLQNLRRARAHDGGVLLLDVGDMFQGTIVSNQGEGAVVIEAYNSLGYQATTIGNHEFDYGPVGPAASPSRPGDDPFGALKARAAQAHFPFLTANIVDKKSGRPLQWPHVSPTTIVSIDGVRIGLVGVGTSETLTTTLAANVETLEMLPLAPTIERYAKQLRQQHADVVVVLAHAGGRCSRFIDPNDLSSCDDGEIFQVVKKLPKGLVDVVVAAHTHGGIAHFVNGVPVIESYAYGRAFGRVDLHIQGNPPRVVSSVVFPPQAICSDRNATAETCNPGAYEGAPVRPVSQVQQAIADDLRRAAEKERQPLGVTVEGGPLRRSYDREGPLGNWMADLMKQAHPGVDVAIINGGGLRADLPKGPVTYGAFYNVFPFDNRFAVGQLSAKSVADLLATNASEHGGFLYVSGIRAKISCKQGRLAVTLYRPDGRKIPPSAKLTVLASDYLVTSHSFSGAGIAADAFHVESDAPIRERIVRMLSSSPGRKVDSKSRELFDPKHPRIVLPSRRPVTCDSSSTSAR